MENENGLREGYHRGYRGKGPRGAKTFRRGRAVAFLQMMQLKRSTIKQQLDEPEFESIRQVLVGELKAIDMLINEFVQLFEIQENEMKDSTMNKEKGMESNEAN